jgi:hypothetical protein
MMRYFDWAGTSGTLVFSPGGKLGSPGAGITPDIGAGNAQQQTEPTEPDRNEHSGCDIAHSCRA